MTELTTVSDTSPDRNLPNRVPMGGHIPLGITVMIITGQRGALCGGRFRLGLLQIWNGGACRFDIRGQITLQPAHRSIQAVDEILAR